MRKIDSSKLSAVAIDWVPVIAVIAVGFANLGVTESWTASTGGRWLFAALIGLPLGWRRPYPLGALLVMVGVITFQIFIVDPSVNFGSFMALILATYAVARHAGMKRAIAGVTAVAAINLLVALAGPPISSPIEFVIPLFYLGGAWGLGRAMRARERRSEELADLADSLRLERDQSARLAVAEERARIARELHDVVAHTMSTIVLQAEAADEIFERDPERAHEMLRTIQKGGRQGLVELRRLLGVLRSDGASGSTPPQPQPVIAELGSLVETMRRAGMDVELDREGELDSLPPGLQLTTYRIVQEALTNTLKHAGPVRARVRLERSNGAVNISVSDAGDARRKDTGTGHGLIGMRERVAMFGGRVETGYVEGLGFVVEATLPLEEGSS
ncbi:MAG TPA: sensor histidine kinase [Actinomycetota bacterium]|nr:sensor histidine kinase [Actinomycetota bacterium]